MAAATYFPLEVAGAVRLMDSQVYKAKLAHTDSAPKLEHLRLTRPAGFLKHSFASLETISKGAGLSGSSVHTTLMASFAWP